VVEADTMGLLIGQDTPEALMPLEVRRAEPGSSAPYATRTRFGWTLNGPLSRQQGKRRVTNSFVQSDVKLERQIERFWRLDTVADAVDVETQMSVNDRKALSIWRDSIRHCDNGHYEVAIPFKRYPPDLVDNIEVAKLCLRALKARLTRDTDLRAMYNESMQDLFENDYAEKVPQEEISSTPVWYLPHHAVVNPSKPGKVRVIFDCSAKHCGKLFECC